MKYQNYRHYILAEQKPDTLESYREYLLGSYETYRKMNPKLFEQETEISYRYRFSIQI